MPRACVNERYFNETWFNASPEEFGQVFSGTMTPAGALVKRTSKNLLAGALASAGVVIKRTSKNLLAGMVTSAGTLAKETFKTLLAGTATTAGALGKRTSKFFAGTLTTAGSTLKSITKNPFSGSVTPTGYFTNSLVTIISYVILSGAMVSSGALSKQTSKYLTGTATTAGAVTRYTYKILSGAVTSAASLVAKPLTTSYFYVSVAGSMAISGSLTTLHTWAKVLTGTVTTAGALAKATSKYLSGLLTPSGELTGPVSQVLRPPFLVLIAIRRLISLMVFRRTRADPTNKKTKAVL